MNSTITSLQAKLEELKKRLKTISTAQSNLMALKAIKEYFSTVQDYLNTINQNYSSHIEECSSHTTSIHDLQSQIDEINLKIENLPSMEDFDFSEMENKLSTLQTGLEELQNKFNSLTENSSATIYQIVSDISLIQTELGVIDDYITTHEQEFLDINATIGDMQTNISNLTTTQDNLTSTQNTFSTSISAIDTRLTKAEKNIDAMSGGIDISAIEERLAKLELFSGSPSVLLKKTDLNWICNNTTNYFYENFSCVAFQPLHIHLKLTFSQIANKNVTIQLVVPDHTHKLIAQDASDEGVFECTFSYLPKHNSNNIGIVFSCNENSILTGYELSIFGTNIKDMEYQKEFSACCFDGYIYISHQYGNYLWYGKYLPTDDINLL